METVERTPVPVRHPVPSLADSFPFGVEFQKSLLRLLTEDTNFASSAMPHLKPGYFENEVLVWAFAFMVQYKERYNAIPSLRVILEETRNLDVTVQEFYRATIETIMAADMTAEEWLRDRCMDFIKRNLFVGAFVECRDLYNQGKVTESYDTMMRTMENIFHTVWETTDREWLFENFAQRYSMRMSQVEDHIPTGIGELDRVLGGGLPIGEMGIWVAYPKRGKTTLLANLGVQAVRRDVHNVLHVVLEGSRRQVAARYDTIFAQEAYWKVKTSRISDETFRQIQFDYQMFQRRLVIRGFTERWNYSAADIDEEMRELRRLHNWRPHLIIVDYGDLLRGRGKNYRNETEVQREAFRDLKTLANRGHGLWTASQAQRPKKNLDADAETLESRSIADCYDKVRVADFLGTINQTALERQALQMRLLAEMYRDNEAGKIFHVRADFSTMTIRDWYAQTDGPLTPIVPANEKTKLNYMGPKDVRVPVQQRAPI